VGDEPTISYVGIRGDEHREGYVSKRENIQTLFPFRKNIWSEDVQKLAVKDRLDTFKEGLKARLEGPALDKALSLADAPLGLTFTLKQKTKSLVDFDTVAFNHAIHHVLKGTDYPVGKLDDFPLLDNAENLIIDDIYNILDEHYIDINRIVHNHSELDFKYNLNSLDYNSVVDLDGNTHHCNDNVFRHLYCHDKFNIQLAVGVNCYCH
jgi:hypothetical protein